MAKYTDRMPFSALFISLLFSFLQPILTQSSGSGIAVYSSTDGVTYCTSGSKLCFTGMPLSANLPRLACFRTLAKLIMVLKMGKLIGKADLNTQMITYTIESTSTTAKWTSLGIGPSMSGTTEITFEYLHCHGGTNA